MKSLFSQIFHVSMLFHEAEVARTAFFFEVLLQKLDSKFFSEVLIKKYIKYTHFQGS